MAKFTVRRRVDSYAIYEAEVEAPTPEDAAAIASENEDKYQWGEPDVVTFDARQFVTLDDEGQEIEETSVGDL